MPSAWAVAVTAILYGTGFLVILTFHSSYNLRGIDDTIFKLKYTHVGLIFIAVPFAVGVAAYTFFNYVSYLWTSIMDNTLGWWRRAWRCFKVFFVGQIPPPEEEPPHPFAISGIMLVVANFYLFLTLAPPNSYRTARPYLWSSLIAFIVGRSILQVIRRRLKGGKTGNNRNRGGLITARVIIRVGIQVFQLYLLYCLLRLRGSDCHEIITHGSFYFGLSLFLGYQAYAIRKRVFGIKNDQHSRRLWQSLGVCVIGLIYYFTIEFYGLSMYHYIPAVKGGGDYTSSPLVRVVLKDLDKNLLAKWLINAENPGGELVLIEATSTAVYVANPADHGGARKWRQARENRPQVQEIARASIVSIEHLQTTWEDWWDHRNSSSANPAVH